MAVKLRILPIGFAAIATLAASAPAAAQAPPSGPAPIRVLETPQGFSLSIDSLSVLRTGDSSFVAGLEYRFPAGVAAHSGVDRRYDVAELDCAGGRQRNVGGLLFRGPRTVPAPPEPPQHAWVPWSPSDAVLLRPACATLSASFGALPADTTGEALPHLENARQVQIAIARGYPPALRDENVTGAVLLRVNVMEDGRVAPDGVRVLWATRREFGSTAVRALSGARFTPATRGGHAVASVQTVPVSFYLIP